MSAIRVFPDDDALFDAVMAGAAGYVLKQIRGSDLVDAVRTVAAGQSLLDPRSTAPAETAADPERPHGPPRGLVGAGEPHPGADRRRPHQPADRPAALARRKTVKNYVSDLLGKLDMRRRTQAAALAARLKAESNPPR